MELYREGFLNKAGKGVLQTHLHSWRPRFFVLEGSCLKYYKSKEILPENLLGCIELSDITSVLLMKNEKHSFQITTKSPKSRTYYMSGKSDDEVMGWIHVIEMAKAKLEKRDTKNTSHNDYDKVFHSKYSELSGVGGTGKPPAKPIPSEYMLVGSSPDTKNGDDLSLLTYDKQAEVSQSEDIKRTSIKKVESHEMTRAADSTECDDDEIPLEDPTYEAVLTSQSEAAKRTSIKKVESREMTRAADSTGCDDDEIPLEDPTYEAVLTSQSEAAKRTSIKKVESREMTRAADSTGCDDDEIPLEDPTYDTAADLYDTVQDVNAGKSAAVQLPPPLPMRPSSLTEAPDSDLTFPVVGVYDEAGLGTRESSKDGKVEEAKKKSEGVKADGAEEKKTSLPVYAKPIRKGKSLKRTNPAMMDIGEVSNDVEKESSGGDEILKMGMTQPIGNRFACEELRELLNKYNEEDNNNDSMSGRSDVTDFDDVDQGGSSAFDVLKRFLEKHQ